MTEIWAHIVSDIGNLFTGSTSAWFAFGQVLLIDIFLAGDNAIIIAALVLRIGFALVVTQLLQLIGLIFAGGVLLLWVSWKMYREIRQGADNSHGSPEIEGDEHSGVRAAKSFAGAAWAVAVADVSMSLDNVLAVAGAARDHPGILMIGLVFAVGLMGIAANVIAKYIDRYRWIAWIGLLVIIYVAFSMIYTGIVDKDIGLLQLV
jgi:YjbE family integral membrane protein